MNNYLPRRRGACHYSPTVRTPHRNSKIDTRSPQGRELDVLWILFRRIRYLILNCEQAVGKGLSVFLYETLI